MKRHDAIRILSGENRSPLAAGLRAATALAEPFYRAAVRRRNARFDAGARPATPLGRPTLSVGNLTTGGTGKTPMVIDLVRRLQNIGHRPAVLLRGYKGQAGSSDETAELRHAHRCDTDMALHRNAGLDDGLDAGPARAHDQAGARIVWERMLASLRKAAVIHPVFLTDSPPGTMIWPRHTSEVGFFTLRVQTQIADVLAVLRDR